jgi:O-antigen/teichoic acid export membrane protein
MSEKRTSGLVMSTGVGMAANAVFALLATILIARALEPAGLGRFQLFVAIAVFAAALAGAGVNEAIAYLLPDYQVSRPRRSRALLLYALRVTAVLAAATGGALFAIAVIAGDLRFSGFAGFGAELRLEAAAIVAFVALSVSLGALRGLDRADQRAQILYGLVGGGFTAACAALFLFDAPAGGFYAARIASYALGALVAIALLLRALPRGVTTLPRPERRELWRLGGGMFLITALAYLVTQPFLDLIAVGAVASDADVGLYAVAAKLATFSYLGCAAFTVVMGPKFAAAFARGDRGALGERFAAAAAWMAIAAGFLAGGLWVVRREALAVFGPEYVAAVPTLLALLGARLALGLLGPNTPLLIAAGKVRVELILTAAATALFAISLVVLSRLFGVIGVALSAGASITALELARHIAARRLFGVRLPRCHLAVLLALAAGLVAGLSIRSIAFGPPLAAAALAGLGYTAAFAIVILAFRGWIPRLAETLQR